VHRHVRGGGDGRPMMIRTAATLFAQLYRSLCVACLADELGATAREADGVACDLAATPRFVREWWVCSRCGEDDIILRYVPMWPLQTGGC
jgi:hypothetical protein